MSIVFLIFRPIIEFTLVASFSLFFMHFFLIAGILTTKIQRNVVDDTAEMKNLGGYQVTALGGIITGLICLIAMMFL